ncbi:tetratricopeptide repeat protein [Mucilaginibacter pedocola]|uniref:NB-ARC domain-containing protein n=1 Tax=Mucilaginibacter pedocola TaxID=1792845 RepID=A0A1S9P8U1_9SPHI|nr:tetratricopeptide repeat protein [Mucilaginibacter pedocola]OOQ57394.1 hypothetical protein BC343_14945 [Mucilaginibacter pedocola]
MKIHKEVFSNLRNDLIIYIRDYKLDPEDWIVDGKPLTINSRKWWLNKIVLANEQKVYVGLTIYGQYTSQISLYERISDEVFGKLPKNASKFAKISGTSLMAIMAGLRVLLNSANESNTLDYYKGNPEKLEKEVTILLDEYVTLKNYNHLVPLLDYDHIEDDYTEIHLGNTAEASQISTTIEFNTITEQTIFLNLIPNLHEEVIGREEDLEKLQILLNESKRIVLVNGLGGIGKSTFAKEYLHKNKHLYSHIAWVNVIAPEADNLDVEKESFASAFAYDTVLLEQGLDLQFSNDTKVIDKYRTIMYALRQLKGRNLLVIDNAGENINYYRETLPTPPGWHILITSRTNLLDFESFFLGTLSETNAIILFSRWYNEESDDQIKSLLEVVGYHTLMIELLAKTLRSSVGLLNINTLIEKLDSKDLSDEILQDKVSTTHNPQEDIIINHLLIAFKIANLNGDEISVLKCFYFLPPEFYSIPKILDYFKKQNDYPFINAIKSLYHKGWLQFDGKAFQMHRLIQLVIYYVLNPEIQVAQPYIETLCNSINASEHFESATSTFISNASFLIKQLPSGHNNNSELAWLNYFLSISYQWTGQYTVSESYNQCAIDYFESESDIGENFSYLAICYKNKAIILRQFGWKAESLEYINKSLAIWESENQQMDQNKAFIHFDLLDFASTFYYECNQITDAEQCLNKCYKIGAQLYDFDNNKYLNIFLTALNRMAGFYFVQERYEEGKVCVDQVISKLSEVDEVTIEQEEILSGALRHSAKLEYQLSKRIDDVIEKFEKSISIYKNLIELSEDYDPSDLGRAYSDYAFVLNQAGKFELAESQYRQSLAIHKKMYEMDQRGYKFDYADVLCQLAITLAYQRKDGLEHLYHAQKLLKELLEDGQDVNLQYYHNFDQIGLIYYNLRNHSLAVNYFEMSNKFYSLNIGNSNPKANYTHKLLRNLKCLAISYYTLQKLDLAVDKQADHYNLCLDLFEQSMIDDKSLIDSAIQLAICYFNASDFERTNDTFKNLFFFIHKYTEIRSTDSAYVESSSLLTQLLGIPFDVWFKQTIIPLF